MANSSHDDYLSASQSISGSSSLPAPPVELREPLDFEFSSMEIPDSCVSFRIGATAGAAFFVSDLELAKTLGVRELGHLSQLHAFLDFALVAESSDTSSISWEASRL